MGFTKLDEGILQSSIMAEDPVTFKIWISLLAACRENGIAYVSPVYLSSVCHIHIDRVIKSIQRLSDPDPLSRSIADEGRRIKRVDGGYEIINYMAYRTASLRGAEAERKRLYRKELKSCPDGVRNCPDASASVLITLSSLDLSSLSSLSWINISSDDKRDWSKAYPSCDINRELLAMIEWMKANPEKGKKKNYRRFITNWLARSQEKGGGMKSNQRQSVKVTSSGPSKFDGLGTEV